MVGKFGFPSREEMLLLLRLAGAEMRGGEAERGKTIVVCEAAEAADRSRIRELVEGGAVVVKPSFVLDSISAYKPQPLEHYLRSGWVAA